MRRFGFLTIALCLSFIGCKPATETVPKVTPKPSSAITEDAAGTEEKTEAPAESKTDSSAAPESKPAEAAPAAEAPASTAPAGNSSTGNGAAVRFVADKKLEVPAMMCPYGCYPTVEKALASVPGVKGVQLAEQPAGTKEGEIALKVVELKLGEGFDLASAIAALKKAEFEAKELN